MELRSELKNTHHFIRVIGRIDTVTAPQLDDMMSQLIESHPLIVLDLSDVDYLSSSAFRIFVKYQKQCRFADGQVIMQGIQVALLSLFKISGFDRLFTFTYSDSESLSIQA